MNIIFTIKFRIGEIHLGTGFHWVLRKRLLEHKEVHLVLVKQDHLLLLVGVHVVQLLTVLLRDHLEASWLHVVHPDIDDTLIFNTPNGKKLCLLLESHLTMPPEAASLCVAW